MEAHRFSANSLKLFFHKSVLWGDMDWEQCGPLAGVPVEASEILSHYLFRKEMRTDDTVKPEAVMPYPHEDLSVTRHRDLSDDEVWESGKVVATKQSKTLFGRAQFRKGDLPNGLSAKTSEPPRNHADIAGWPSERSDQMAQAIRLAGACSGIRLPVA
jgi:hypothetical protein